MHLPNWHVLVGARYTERPWVGTTQLAWFCRTRCQKNCKRPKYLPNWHGLVERVRRAGKDPITHSTAMVLKAGSHEQQKKWVFTQLAENTRVLTQLAKNTRVLTQLAQNIRVLIQLARNTKVPTQLAKILSTYPPGRKHQSTYPTGKKDQSTYPTAAV